MSEQTPALVAVPNVSEGRDRAVLDELERAFEPARTLDIHSDGDHGRSVFTLAGAQGDLAEGLVRGAAAALERIDVNGHTGLHPFVGSLDVMPVVYLDEGRRGAACAEAITAAGRIGAELSIPVLLYGELATRADNAERAQLRRGGWVELAGRIESGDVVPDFGPRHIHPTAGAILAGARPPLIAFNIDLASDDVELAREIAAQLRESGGGLPGVRAIGLYLEDRGRAQVSTNVHDYRATPLAEVLAAVRARTEVAEAELVGLAPSAAFDGFPRDVALRAFDPERHLLENALRSEPVTPPSPA